MQSVVEDPAVQAACGRVVDLLLEALILSDNSLHLTSKLVDLLCDPIVGCPTLRAFRLRFRLGLRGRRRSNDLFGLNPKIRPFWKLVRGNLLLRESLFSQFLCLVHLSDHVMHRHNPGFLRPIRGLFGSSCATRTPEHTHAPGLELYSVFS